MRPNIVICPIKRLYQILKERGADGAVAIISSSYGAPDPTILWDLPHVYAIYRDIDYESPGAFLEDHATHFAELIKNITPEIETLYCCCDAGQSRSPAVAAAVGRYFGIDMLNSVWRNPNYSPNIMVFEKMSRALGIEVSDEELDMLQQESRQAFRKAIAQARNKSKK